MKYAFFPGCVSQGGAPELYPAARMVCDRMGIELEEIPGWTCTGAGVIQEKNQLFGDTLNARNFAKAEQMGLPILTICSTCQGVMSQANHRMRNPGVPGRNQLSPGRGRAGVQRQQRTQASALDSD